jgi:DNA-binding MarR family transcriptional regulator
VPTHYLPPGTGCGQGFEIRKLLHNQYICICIYLDMSRSPLPVLPCMCGSFRRTARALTQLYETALRPLGLRATQLTILQVLSLAGEVSQGQLGEMLAMDSTSLTRTLAIMVREGWIAERRGKDQRERWLGLSSGGETKLKRALPVWEKVQSRLRRQLGDQTWNNLLKFTHQVTGLITTKGDSL